MRRKTIAIVGVVLAAALLATFLLNRKGPPPQEDSSVFKLFGGKDGLMTVAHPTKVEAFRLKENIKRDGTEFTDLNNNYEVTAGPVSVPETLATELSAVLILPQAYEREFHKACMPRYGVRLSFQRGSDHVDVYLCFECDMLLVTRNGLVTADRSSPGGENFDPMTAILARAVKTLFPDDSEIQELKVD